MVAPNTSICEHVIRHSDTSSKDPKRTLLVHGFLVSACVDYSARDHAVKRALERDEPIEHFQPVAGIPDDIVIGQMDAIERERSGRACPDTEIAFRRPDGDPRDIQVEEERRDVSLLAEARDP